MPPEESERRDSTEVEFNNKVATQRSATECTRMIISVSLNQQSQPYCLIWDKISAVSERRDTAERLIMPHEESERHDSTKVEFNNIVAAQA